MAGDIKLTDAGAVVEGTLQVEGGEVHSGGAGGYSFADRTQAGQRWVWYAQDGEARLFTDGAGDRLRITATSELLSQGGHAGYAFMDRTQAGQRWVWYAQDGEARLFTDGAGDRLRITATSELLSLGGHAGYAFMDRTKAGQRWVWYAQDGRARLHVDGAGDRLTVLPDGRVGIGTDKPSAPLHVQGKIMCDSILAVDGAATLDLVAEIRALRKEIAALKAKVGA